MRIAICDKDITFSNKLKHILYTYSNLYNLDFFIEIFDSGEKLLNSQNKYALIFMEYTLNGINGIETAREMRRRKINTKIIFTTTNTNCVFEAFNVKAYQFLKKPICQNQLYKTLSDFLTNSNTHHPLWLNNNDNTICLSSEEIIYIEANNKYCLIHLKNKDFICKKTMARVFETLPEFHFKKIHRSFIVNLKYIEKYNHDNVFLENGVKLHLTRTYYKNFKKAYFEYFNPKII